MRYEFDVNKVDIVNLNGKDLRKSFEEQEKVPFDKYLGNLVYEQSRDLDMVNKAIEIHKGNKIELSEREKGLLETCLTGRLMPFIERRVLAQIVKVGE